MKPIALALAYMQVVFSTKNMEALRELLANNLQFKGPFFNFNTAEDYINSMLKSPPEGFEYQIIKTISDETSACLVYQFSKPGVSTTMTQVFETSNGKIDKIWLVFDTKAFTE